MTFSIYMPRDLLTLLPALARSNAMERPRPRLAPVTMTTFSALRRLEEPKGFVRTPPGKKDVASVGSRRRTDTLRRAVLVGWPWMR